MIYTLEYVSTLVRPLDEDETAQLLTTSRAYNAARGVTGTLLFRGQRAMQLLEGDEAEVRGLYRRIADDPRHTDVVRVWESRHMQRRFPDWAMQFDDLTSSTTDASENPVWLEVDLPALPDPGPETPLHETREYVRRRAIALRRALASGDRLTTTLAIILHGHRPEAVLEDDAVVRLHCAECRNNGHTDIDHYPCPTAKNAIWALEATAPRAHS